MYSLEIITANEENIELGGKLTQYAKAIGKKGFEFATINPLFFSFRDRKSHATKAANKRKALLRSARGVK